MNKLKLLKTLLMIVVSLKTFAQSPSVLGRWLTITDNQKTTLTIEENVFKYLKEDVSRPEHEPKRNNISVFKIIYASDKKSGKVILGPDKTSRDSKPYSIIFFKDLSYSQFTLIDKRLSFSTAEEAIKSVVPDNITKSDIFIVFYNPQQFKKLNSLPQIPKPDKKIVLDWLDLLIQKKEFYMKAHPKTDKNEIPQLASLWLEELIIEKNYNPFTGVSIFKQGIKKLQTDMEVFEKIRALEGEI